MSASSLSAIEQLNVAPDDSGLPLLHVYDAQGDLLAAPEPILRWAGAVAVAASTDSDVWALSFSGTPLLAWVTPLDRGAHGEWRLDVALRNNGDTPIKGTLLPPLAGWADVEDHGQGASIQHLLLRPPEFHLGTFGKQHGWYVGEMSHDVTAIVPSKGNGYLTATLLRKTGSGGRAELEIQPGQEIGFELRIDGGTGGRDAALHELYRVRGGYRVDPESYDYSEYENPALIWANDILAGWLNWAWDRDNLDPVTGEYRLADSLARARDLFGGYDVYMVWPFWPRAGWDDQGQFDHFRNMPGGLTGLRAELARCRELGVRAIVSSCHWSETEQDISHSESYRQLVDLALELDADGVLMDIMSSTPPELREMMRQHGRELLPYAEGDATWEDSQTNILGRIHNMFPTPFFNLKRYLLPHHSLLRVCEPGHAYRWYHRDFVLSFFNGHGVEINTMFPSSHPRSEQDWPILARALDIMRANRANFRSTTWEPLTPTLNDKVWVNRWPGNDHVIHTIVGTDPAGHRGPLLRLPNDPDLRYVDLWRYRELDPVADPDDARWLLLPYDVPPFQAVHPQGMDELSPGCIAVLPRRMRVDLYLEMLTVRLFDLQGGEQLEIWRDTVRPDKVPVRPSVLADAVEIDLFQAFGEHTNEAIVVRLLDAEDQLLDVAVIPETYLRYFRSEKAERTTSVDQNDPPHGMVRIPTWNFEYIVEQGAPMWMALHYSGQQYGVAGGVKIRDVSLPAFWIDKYPVTNAQFADFVAAGGYQPAHPENFLAHFVDGRPPRGQEDHPVVYVSLGDARAYAAWANKRLPTEEEWYLAAGAIEDDRPWPWGDTLEPGHCNMNLGHTTPVDAHPEGASPFGVEDLVGNVWQYTADLYDNGRHTLVLMRGGSFHTPPEGSWWVKGGPRAIRDHHPLPLFGPSMNRLATVGFRCVKDE